MSGLCGWFDARSARLAGRQVPASTDGRLNRFDGGLLRTASADFGSLAIAAATAGSDVHIFQDELQIVGIWGRARFTDRTLEEFAKTRGMARALAEGYAGQSSNILAALAGSFALAILDGRRGEALLAVDRMGTRPLCYEILGERLMFGTTLEAIGGFSPASSRLCRQAIYNYLHFHMIPGPRTVYAGRRRLLPGCFALWRNGQAEIHPYRKLQFIENERRPFTELKTEFVSVLRQAVRDGARDGKVGAFLSGGTDSSTIAGLLTEVTGAPARTYSIGFDAQGFDEMSYARIAARHFGTEHHEYYVTPDDVVAAIPRIAAVHDEPFGNSSAVPTYYCAKLAKDDGVDTLLAGDGGDELFGGNARYATQYLYSIYGDLPLALRTRLIEPLVFALPPFSFVAKARRYMRNASQPMPARYDSYNLLERFGPRNVFTNDFLDGVDTQEPTVQVARAYQEAGADTLINRMLALDFKYTLADNDLPKVRRSCELAGVEVRFPMLDDAVVAFSARLAPELKLKSTRLRYFFKRALREFLPPEIIAKKKHGFGLPFGRWLLTHGPLQQIALDSLADLKKRMIIRSDFIDQLASKHVRNHADYFGTMVWVLMMLEQWFRQHRMSS